MRLSTLCRSRSDEIAMTASKRALVDPERSPTCVSDEGELTRRSCSTTGSISHLWPGRLAESARYAGVPRFGGTESDLDIDQLATVGLDHHRVEIHLGQLRNLVRQHAHG